MNKILIVGAGGQIGTELKMHLRKLYGSQNVIAADLKANPEDENSVALDATCANQMAEIVKKEKIDTIYNLVALLSAKGEENPMLAWRINMGALINALEVSREFKCQLFTPSSIGAFGPDAPKNKTPQNTVMHPTTIYGVCKVTGEMLSNYYFQRFGVDTRSVRFPGLISSSSLPGGGTTDYAVEVFYSALRGEKFVCPVPRDRFMDMMYMPDAMTAMQELMEADPSRLVVRNSYNVASMSFSPGILFSKIKDRIPAFDWEYAIDPVKDQISSSWPNFLDDSCARREWDW
ncbi:MAG: NAD-dependent epimerase/dehydratase family protein, partial [Mucinivorans sp.]